MDWIDRLLTAVSLDGAVPAKVASVAMIVAVLALLALAAFAHFPARPRRGLLRAGIAVAVGVVLTVVVRIIVEDLWKPYPDVLPLATWAVIGCGIAGIALAVAAVGRRGARTRKKMALRTLGAAVCGVILVAGSAALVNVQFSAYPTAGALFGVDGFDTEDPATALAPRDETVAAAPGETIAQALPADWTTPTGDRPTEGVVTDVAIPGELSHFPARTAKVYLPPAYFAEPRPELPVVVAMAGEPGSPEDWTTSLQMPQVMNAFAAQHNGIAPIVVVADPIAERLGNTLCVDSPRGNADTYLAQDVPNWIDKNLQASTDHSQWAVAGYSFGGTCAVQLALAHPELYPNFLAMSPQQEPTIGTRAETVDAFFGGDENAFARHNPLDILAANRFPELHASYAVGTDDSEYGPATEALAAASKKAGIDVESHELPGGHDYSLWHDALEENLPWLSHSLRLA
ncbi:alpha/beta hydrolase [Dietzia timorensis]|uniref:Esterase n=1 Tax=Dietzia timorensis TaxID=499555 RepID=A0A173LM86_9ACTN|nr:alpha/beta hydrolase-fold protein [Dietzia timorensis]ANI93003.1 Uncharacterized protein BJL86_2238 [Dietzia timorensis]